MSDRKDKGQQALQYLLEATRLIEETKSGIELEVDYMKGYARDTQDFRKLSEQYECLEGALEGIQKAVFNLNDVIW